MQKNNMSRYLSKGAVFGFLASDDNKEKEIDDSDRISNDGSEDDKKEISLNDLSSEEEMDNQPCPCAAARYFISKSKTWQIILFACNTGRAAVHNVIRQSLKPTNLVNSQWSEISDIVTDFTWESKRTS